jgi:hypothetical protein
MKSIFGIPTGVYFGKDVTTKRRADSNLVCLIADTFRKARRNITVRTAGYAVVTGCAASPLFSSCSEQGGESAKPIPTALTYDKIGGEINAITVNGADNTITITSVSSEVGGIDRYTTYQKNSGVSGEKVNITFRKAGLTTVNTSGTGALIGTLENSDNIQIRVNSTASDITATSSDGSKKTKVLQDQKSYAKVVFKNFSDQDGGRKFWNEAAADSTGIWTVKEGAAFKYGGVDWVIK